MNELLVAERATHWHRLKALVLDSVSSPITRRVYNLGLDEFIAWFGQEPRPAGFTKATVTAWRVALEARKLRPTHDADRASTVMLHLLVRVLRARRLVDRDSRPRTDYPAERSTDREG